MERSEFKLGSISIIFYVLDHFEGLQLHIKLGTSHFWNKRMDKLQPQVLFSKR